MPSVSKAQHRFFGYLKGNPEVAAAKGISPKTVHDFASTPEAGLPEHADSGAMPKSKRYYMADGAAPDHWQQGAVKRPGALTRNADKVGESPMTFAHQHYGSPGLTGQQARYAVNAQKRR
jgi:hypothetical protein